jgi:hypothetical protein
VIATNKILENPKMRLNFLLTGALLLVINFVALSQKEPNQDYIDKQIKKIKKPDNSDFLEGYFMKGVTQTKCKIYLKKGKISKNSFLFIITGDSDSKQLCYSAKDIDGYSVNGNKFRKCVSYKAGVVSYFFIRLVENGKITLYEKESTPNDFEFAYYLSPPGNKMYYIAPFTGNILDLYKEGQLLASSDRLLGIQTNKIDERFKAGFSKLLQDCPPVVNKILSGFYGINDIEKIIREYNKLINY